MTSMKEVYSGYQQMGRALTDGAFSASMLPPVLPREELDWANSEHRLLIVGQEPWGRAWNESKIGKRIERLTDFFQLSDTVESLIAAFPSFRDQVDCLPPEQFWRFLNHIGKVVDKTDSSSITYTNLVKCATIKSPKCHLWTVSDDIRSRYLAWQTGMLRRELHVLRPTMILFLTGPYYDPFLKLEFDGLAFTAMLGYTERQAASLIHPDLGMPAFRTYHPGYLSRSFGLDPINAALQSGRFC